MKHISHLHLLQGVLVLSDITGQELFFFFFFLFQIFCHVLEALAVFPKTLKDEEEKPKMKKKHCPDVVKQGHFQTRPFFLLTKS